ncbi:hypothetical protein CHU32_13730 [Superficieibacter electus]|uniref:Uncharacterized protein n=1 Tax=Superficieibacter electus TaxID=2022662 RepID=A0A2P5GP31_9ENTR|nr:hypothetical protein [Superficieibacter electus]POP44938.1 hypothetical protein CHU33_10805 [Superficieibacter electus]POP48325.1 hypothetical protein CHU32_13730 [Superficieibacter electus]
MRITVLDDDLGKKINPTVERYKVFLNGEEVKHCFTADDEKGQVICGVFIDGRIVLQCGEVKRQTLQGTVRIERCE